MSSPVKKIEQLNFPWQTQDPFLFCAYHLDAYPEGKEDLTPNASLDGRMIGQDFAGIDGWNMYHGSTVPGFPQHPHYGFETITIALEGLVDHADSMGAAGRFGNGDVQWMTAGGGVNHSEMFPLHHSDQPNPMLMFQIWLNLPGKSKRVDPHFRMLWSEEIPKIKVKDEQGKESEVTLVAGEFNGEKALKPTPDSWAADSKNDVNIYVIKMEAGAKLELPVGSEESNRTLYFHKGDLASISGKEFEINHAVHLAPNAETTIENGNSEGHFLLLQGKPMGEPVVKYGPFVTNTNAELQEVVSRYQRTQFGGWPWPKNDQVHEKGRGRFALHADGMLDEKD